MLFGCTLIRVGMRRGHQRAGVKNFHYRNVDGIADAGIRIDSRHLCVVCWRSLSQSTLLWLMRLVYEQTHTYAPLALRVAQAGA